MVAVAHGKDHGHALQALVLLAHVGGIIRQNGVEGIHVLAVHQPAGDVAAALHQVEVIQLLHAVLFGADGLDEHLFMVIAQHQDMGQLDGGVPADPLAGGDALGNGALGGTDGGGGAHGVIIGVQVHHADEALADGAVFQGALHIDQAVGIGLKDVVFHILRHGLVDSGGVGGFLLGAQLRLGQDQIDGGDRAFRVGADALPVGLVRGELVAGDHCPLGHIAVFGQQDVGGQEYVVVHGKLLLS